MLLEMQAAPIAPRPVGLLQLPILPNETPTAAGWPVTQAPATAPIGAESVAPATGPLSGAVQHWLCACPSCREFQSHHI